MKNIFTLPENSNLTEEVFEKLCEGKSFRLERIISTGQVTPTEKWYDQAEDEWVILLQGKAKILFDDETRCTLFPGDYVLIPAHRKHKVVFTSTNPAAIWLAVYF